MLGTDRATSCRQICSICNASRGHVPPREGKEISKTSGWDNQGRRRSPTGSQGIQWNAHGYTGKAVVGSRDRKFRETTVHPSQIIHLVKYSRPVSAGAASLKVFRVISFLLPVRPPFPHPFARRVLRRAEEGEGPQGSDETKANKYDGSLSKRRCICRTEREVLSLFCK